MTNISLRQYQIDCIDAICEKRKNGVNRQIVHLPTGAGKTVIFSALVRKLNIKTLIIAHTCELLQQSKDKLRMVCPDIRENDIGIVDAFSKQFDRNIVISSIQSARKQLNLNELISQNFDLLIYDECHHASSDSAREVITQLGFGKDTSKLLVGFTATPCRSDNRGLAEDFDEIVYTKSIQSMILQGFLCHPKGVKVGMELDLSSVKEDSSGDYSSDSLFNTMNTEKVLDIITDTYINTALRKKAICFGVNVQHAINISDHFTSNGIRSESIDGTLSKTVRDGILHRFNAGEIDVLTNCMVLTEGFDCPDIECVIIARPTKYIGLYQQMCGRGLRLFPNKEHCLIIDFCDKDHTLRSVSDLTFDIEIAKREEFVEKKENIPKTLNKVLKAYLIDHNVLGSTFKWKKIDVNYSIEGSYMGVHIMCCHDGLYSVVVKGVESKNHKILASQLSFDYAFDIAEEFAKKHRKEFIIADHTAQWNEEPISAKQIAFLKWRGYRAGISDLNKGQANTIIGKIKQSQDLLQKSL